MTFESTLPFGTPDLMRVSDFQRYLDELVLTERSEGVPGFTASLSPSLMMDLQRVEQTGQTADVLVVIAASLRHGHSLAVHLQSGEKVLPLTVFPAQQLAHCPVPLEELLGGRLSDLRVMHVEPAVLRPPGDPQAALVGDRHLYHPLPQLTWDMALRGARDELLPEIAGQAAYRISPGTDLRNLGLSGTLLAAVQRLQRQSINLRDLAEWPGFDRVRAARLLNALYLQAGLIVSRTHPAATGGR
ncbi:hypothetical protein MW290_31070 [Aquincola tertiaricarbonis]|uniref:Uncharacterized protein n=1 Tax=Aquincola tertiaricarbonis TaxID=391953 RepID=A0ABY4SFA3_AQUTE|nr:hypothetical protein [Aquincola tertiaricarbonis]URI09980.1 hypothetical protein MW290_31070 [Aquincola tertiaricarbonis]